MVFVWQRLVDARGCRHRACTIRHACQSSGYAWEYLVARHERGGFWVLFLLVTLVYGVCLGVWDQLMKPLFGLSKGIQINSYFDLFRFLVLGMILGLVFGLMNKLYGWRSPAHAVAAMTRAGLCPSCAYQIDEIEPDDDDCTVCPECGGAWRIVA